MATDTVDNAVKTKRPADSAFKQQRLAAWQPILTAGTVLPTFFVIGIAFIPVGIGLVYFSEDVKEHIIDYTDCPRFVSDTCTGLSKPECTWKESNETCANFLAKEANKDKNCTCLIPFELKQDFQGHVFMYYGLSNYYQNHRRYVKSRDDNQLLGRLSREPSDDCVPFAYLHNETTGKQQPIAPCGAIANSLFSDVLKLWFIHEKEVPKEVPLLRTGIAWDSDKHIKFKNPDGASLKDAFKNFAKPKAWKKHIYELDQEDPSNNGFQNEDLIVWMRTAALPTFRKLYRRVNHNATGYKDGLIRGSYQLEILYSYDVKPFDGSKRMILSTTSLLGGKNPFLGIAYIVVGCICLLLGITLLFIHIKCGKSTSEMINVHSRTPWTPQ